MTALTRSTPETSGISSAAIDDFLGEIAQKNIELHSLIIVRHGSVIAEGWWKPYQKNRNHMLFSLSKSFTSTAAGMAVAEGKLSLDDAVISFFPDDLPETISPNLAAMRVRDLLAMATGHAADTVGWIRDGAQNWARAFLSQPVEFAPGTHFVYNSGATYMASAIVQKVVGQTVLDYLTPRLFVPLGIENPKWDVSPQGINVGGWGLNITTEDIAKFGLLYLQKGVWAGRQILPEAWIDDATTSHISNGDDPNSDWAQGYGFQFWRCRHGAYRGDGAFGQFCVVLPEQDAVVAITAGTGDLQGVLNAIWTHLLSAFSLSKLPEDAQSHALLTRKLDALSLPIPEGAGVSPLSARVSGVTFRFDSAADVKTARWDFSPDGVVFHLDDARVEASFDDWRPGASSLLAGRFLIGDASQVCVARAAWTTPETLILCVQFVETPFSLTLTASFDGETVRLERVQNVTARPESSAPQIGRADAFL